ncbi:BES1/BZR1 homolog protein 3-like [Carex rostrata]
MATGSRMPTWRERENNKRRERRRRAIGAKIYTGLRMYGNYSLPKHCDNNEVLKALCHEAGWIVEEDGTTYRKGSKPVHYPTEMHISSRSPSTCSSSYQPSPLASYSPSPVASAYVTRPGTPTHTTTNQNPLNLSKFNSISAPVTPPLCSPTPGSPRARADWLTSLNLPSEPVSPTFSLVSVNPFSVAGCNSRMWTPGQSGTCSPVNYSDEFAFGFSGNHDMNAVSNAVVKPWEGERIHEEYVSDELDLTLGNSKSRSS